MKIAFDIGGVIGKYPAIYIPIMKVLVKGGIEVYILPDIPERKRALNAR
jgi:hypothetical protein